MEIIDIYNKRREKTNKTCERGKEKDGEYGLSVHIWIMNKEGKFLVQKRTKSRKRFPNMWSLTAGAVDTGETSVEGAIREAKEEIGINIEKEEFELILSIKRKHNFLDIWLVRKDIDLKDIVMQEEEVQEVKWVTKEELEEMIKNDEVAGTVTLYYKMFFTILEIFKKKNTRRKK